MKVVRFDQLGEDELAQWRRIRAAGPGHLDSPYFDPEFAAAVHAGTGDVQVVLGAGSVFAVRCTDGTARPVGWPAADFQGPVLEPGAAFDPAEVVSALGVRALHFDHLVTARDAFEPWVERVRPSPYLEVGGGMDGYLALASKSGRDNMGQARRRARKAEREHGELRFEVDLVDHDVLDQVIELKRGQYRATEARDYFAVEGRRELLHRLLDTRTPGFAGILSAVFVGDRLLAAHFGLRSAGVLHWWFPVYDPEFGGYAPGWVLLRELVTAAPEQGFTRIDLGRGEDEYKRRAMTGQVEVAEGFVAGRAAQRWRRATRTVRGAVVASPLAPLAKTALRKLGR